jgi:hypothetical protein
MKRIIAKGGIKNKPRRGRSQLPFDGLADPYHLITQASGN